MACSDEVWMLEHSMYTVLSPEGFASIMWKDAKLATKAAEIMHIEPEWLKKQGIVERVLPEQVLENQAEGLKELIEQKLKKFQKINLTDLLDKRHARYRKF